MSSDPTPRISSAQLARLVPDLSPRDWGILRFLARHRFATTLQLRRACFPDHATPSAATRACVRVLDRHLHHRLLGRLERRVGGIRHGSSSFIWHLDVAGYRLLQGADDQRRHRFTAPSPVFLDHTLAVTETHVVLHEAARTGALALEQVQIESEAWRPFLDRHGVATILKPDLYVEILTTDYDDHWYVEVDRGTEHLPVLLAKCRAYAAYQATGRAQAEHGVFPRVLWLLPTPAREARLRAAVRAAPDLSERLFAFTTTDNLLSIVADQDPSPTHPKGETS
ncbi:replication-relaxation family protein [Microbacterium paludicola]|uniref:replication-relaxation family protein n=1 Tax=Microbacterium paludicola TaxID=300019 RepID=UPI0009042D7E|nr:replication-relaxation family protein [Microbacterium paludicola]APF32864.1 hypothetical protein BO218_00505 [Microbacterium paludicola]